MNTSRTRSALLFTLALSGMSLLAPTSASAQVRLSALGGVEHLADSAQSVPSVAATGRVEATVGLLLWLHVGAYLGTQTDFTAPAGASYGAITALRPHIPFSPIDPFAFASVGWLEYPTSRSSVGSSWEGQAGGGLTLHASELIDVEARLAYVGLFGRSDSGAPLGGNGYAASGGVAVHF